LIEKAKRERWRRVKEERREEERGKHRAKQ
jgi:hypothetical protein